MRMTDSVGTSPGIPPWDTTRHDYYRVTMHVPTYYETFTATVLYRQPVKRFVQAVLDVTVSSLRDDGILVGDFRCSSEAG